MDKDTLKAIKEIRDALLYLWLETTNKKSSYNDIVKDKVDSLSKIIKDNETK